ncbi:Glycosyltransferase involved in cell wall bisynthesis [Selenomonas sp. GACV-9]|uniref:glycosyltransferase family 4 protein n=1 Tax=Selenomonas sp. GACV-9 TaxID=3158782 RepID=UPI0008E56A15|nr:Glycosyltransferase involved in cell wall bisynthesis [Selenomonas ruminantium]
MKVAIVHDWFVTYAGAERVVEQLLELYPDADLFSTVDFLPEGQREFIKNKKIHTTFIQKLPGARRHYRTYLPLMPLAIEQLDLSGYDLVISSSSCVSKGVITGPNQVHVSYVHSPVRYAWDLTHQYLNEANLNHGMKGWLAKVILHYMRMWDTRTANGVDYYIANSKFIAKRIKKVYGRDAKVIYPPVDIEAFSYCEKKEEYYLTASRLVPYKKVKLIVEAFNDMPDKKLVVIGDGPDFAKIKAIAGENIILMGYQPFDVLKEKMQHAKAFVFAAEEDFGITPVEAQACGTPVIAYGKGGALETVEENKTGIFFDEQTVASIANAVNMFSDVTVITAEKCRKNAEKYGISRFRNELQKHIGDILK